MQLLQELTPTVSLAMDCRVCGKSLDHRTSKHADRDDIEDCYRHCHNSLSDPHLTSKFQCPKCYQWTYEVPISMYVIRQWFRQSHRQNIINAYILTSPSNNLNVAVEFRPGTKPRYKKRTKYLGRNVDFHLFSTHGSLSSLMYRKIQDFE